MKELCYLVKGEFSKDDDASIRIKFELKDETLEFESVEDIENQQLNTNVANNFSVSAFGGGKHVTLESYDVVSSIFGSSATVWSSSDRLSWCTGINETIHSFLKKKRLWYHYIVNSYFLGSLGLIFFALIFIPKSIEKLIYSYLNLSEISFLSIKTAIVVFWFFCFVGKKRMLPTGRIVFSKHRLNFFNYFVVFGSLAGIVTMIVTILSYLE